MYIDYKLMKRYPNKYELTPKNIKKLKVVDWDKLKKYTWFNTALNKPCWCHLEGCNKEGQRYNDEDEFWIGFYEDGQVQSSFSSYEGMCHYRFTKFYDVKQIDNEFDMMVQVNTIRFLNMLLDENIIEMGE